MDDFKKLDASIDADKVREIGASLVRSENLVSGPNAAQKAFQATVQIGGRDVTVRAVLNRVDKLRSVHIRK